MEIEPKREVNHYNWDKIRTQIADDRKFLLAFTNEEFIESESRRLNIDKSYVDKALRECGFYKVDLKELSKVDFSVAEFAEQATRYIRL